MKCNQLVSLVVVFVLMCFSGCITRLDVPGGHVHGEAKQQLYQQRKEIVAAATKLWFTRNCVGLSVRKYVREVLLPVTAVSVASALIPFGIWISMGRGFLRFVLVICTSLAFTALSVYFLGMTSRERKHAREFLLEKIRFAK